MRRLSLFSFFLAASSIGLQAQEVGYNDIARFVAAKTLPSESPLQAILARPSVQRHYLETRDLSEKWEDSRLRAIRQWAATEIQPRLARPQCVKYMFGGPDFVHAVSILPGAPEYILVGLEPLGAVPNILGMPDAELDRFLSHLNYTLRSISRRNFFITREMREDFGKLGVDGVFPVLLYFASLTGHDVIDASYVRLDGNGEAVMTSPESAGGIWLRIREQNPGALDPPEQNLYYFKTDLSNSGFKGGSLFHKFLSARPDSVGYLKAASFLMHTDAFTNIRNYLVGDCRFLLQDASGIPAEFMSRYYDMTFYGNYVGPIEMFSEFDQPWLHEVYRSGVAKPLPFGTGYRMRDEDSIQILGVRK